MPERFAIRTLGPGKRVNPLASEGFFARDGERIAVDPHLSQERLPAPASSAQVLEEGFEIAGPRQQIYFDPQEVTAAVVTCGGLCPGLNAVIRGLVMQLWHRYGIRNIFGIPHGYQGFRADSPAPSRLDPDAVATIHALGGTILGSSRGSPPVPEIVDRLEQLGINQLYVVGGDGTMRGGHEIHQEITARGRAISVVGIPKTIDNDIPFVRKSFGFETAVELAMTAVNSGHTEAIGAQRGIGLVKLMGRHSGFIAATATLASGHVNFCLVPEISFSVDSFFDLLARRVQTRGHALVVVAEGAGQELFQGEPLGVDASGNHKLGDIGTYLAMKMRAYFADESPPVSVRYIDPSYMIRASAANPADQLLCTRFAQNAVHAAMSGRTGMLIGYWHGRMTHVPFQALQGHSQRINPQGELWFNVRETTGQPM